MSTTSKLAGRQEIAEGTMAFRFERPSGWTLEAGQAIDITLLAPSETDAEGNTRTFTIASAPYEKTLMVATRMRDTAFKRVLKVMPVGAAVQIEGPTGVLTLHSDATRAAVFLCGGIGIAFPKHRVRRGQRTSPSPDVSFLLEPQAGGCSIPRRITDAGKGESQLQAHREHDRDGEIAPAMAR